MHRFLRQTDLLYHIVLDFDPKDWPSLARVSRPFFYSTIPLIWPKVVGVQKLLALIPGAKISVSGTLPKLEIPRIDPCDLRRFNIYAPHVRYLEIYEKDAAEYDIINWQALGQHAKVEPLLPNLIQLTLTAPFAIKSQQQMLWIRMFLSPSVIEIQVARPDSETPSIAMPTSLCLLRHISTIASGVQRLSLFIENNDDDQREVDPDATWFWEPPLHSSLRSLAALQELTCTQAVLAVETFSVIASLTGLNVLNIWMDGDTSDFWDSPYRKHLPPIPFPALKYFSMRGVDAVDSWFVLESLAFQNLPSLRLGLQYHPDSDMTGPGDDPWEYELIELIAKTCPRLTELRIDFDEDGRYDEPRNLFAPAERGGDAIMTMSKLPLETLYISSALLGDTCESFPIDSKYCADYLMTAWPQLTRVHLPHFVGHFDSLYEFSQLPNLEELTLRLFFDCFSFEEGNFNYDTDLDELEIGAAPLSTLNTSYMMLPSEVASDLTARTLLHFWPNLERITLRLDPDNPVGDYSSILDDLEETNQEIQKLRDTGSSSSSNPSSDGSESSVQL